MSWSSPFLRRPLCITVLVLASCFSAAYSGAQDADCLKCHEAILKNRPVVHGAVQMGCSSCHSGIADATIPHKTTTPRGLLAPQPDLCYGCHDKTLFTRKNVHPALALGCTACHNPHASAKPKLLSAEVPDQCEKCHSKAGFSLKNSHVPVAGGMCFSCHDPHSSDNMAMLLKPMFELCTECHDQVTKRPHAIAGFTQSGHPLGQVRKDRIGKDIFPPDDPLREGRPFSCASCHFPHSSDFRKLFRFEARSTMDLCMNCHKY
ncbi:MAG: hypothetical protein OEW15_01350 [Nitrospirota bacterium]|nr:hypothetical protein [Nitrospirota bacterium]